jgi:putative nucleotidyltransferase with HDIG domain
VLFAVAYFGLNSWLIAIAIALETRLKAFNVWREHFLWLSLNYFCGASVAVLLVVSTRQLDVRFIGLMIPLLLVLYFTFKVSMDRVEDANKHVEKVSRLYLSTIETLAMAIDAKDQITHGHIRRVQRYAVGLARAVGIQDESLIRGLEAAALLHDMGKLAVPEHILNKPGRLTPAEFEKMKLHASVGADILSAIDFPYPVVPIVRHHHESWDGSGYPDGLKGTDIPIGARILAVVDCFDALTSDRPYRPRLTDQQALEILAERKGIMYDPLVVEGFENTYEQLTKVIQESPRANNVIGDEPQALAIPSGRSKLAVLAKAIKRDGSDDGFLVSTFGGALAKQAHDTTPSNISIFYSYDSNSDSIVASHVCGDSFSSFMGFRIPLGQRLSGWVAANHQSVMNSDPTLDFSDLDLGGIASLKSCMSKPILISNELIGVLSLYSADPQAFSAKHSDIIETAVADLRHHLQQEPLHSLVS